MLDLPPCEYIYGFAQTLGSTSYISQNSLNFSYGTHDICLRSFDVSGDFAVSDKSGYAASDDQDDKNGKQDNNYDITSCCNIHQPHPTPEKFNAIVLFYHIVEVKKDRVMLQTSP
jgi:hypothetical protein